jgi:hypothetical protein
MKTLMIEINGKTDGDLSIALDEVKKKVEQGYLSGFDRNDTGNYEFDIKEN